MDTRGDECIKGFPSEGSKKITEYSGTGKRQLRHADNGCNFGNA